MAELLLPDGVRYFYRDRGEGVPLVFIHGWGTSGAVFEGQATDLAGAHRVITLDWRGCGRSDHPRDGNSISQIAHDVNALIDRVGLEQPVLIGSSIGGNIALELILQNPANIRGAVLVDAPQHWAAEGIGQASLEDWARRLRADRANTFRGMVSTWFGPRGSDTLRQWMLQLLFQSGWFIDSLVLDMGRHDVRDRLASVDTPIALFHGALDVDVPLRVSEVTAALAANASVVVFDDCAHMPHLENPSAFNEKLLTFLEGLPRAASSF
jgi:non-heme chloroperoxidase